MSHKVKQCNCLTDQPVMIDLAKPCLMAGDDTPDRQVKCNLAYLLQTEEVTCTMGRDLLTEFYSGERDK